MRFQVIIKIITAAALFHVGTAQALNWERYNDPGNTSADSGYTFTGLGVRTWYDSPACGPDAYLWTTGGCSNPDAKKERWQCSGESKIENKTVTMNAGGVTACYIHFRGNDSSNSSEVVRKILVNQIVTWISPPNPTVSIKEGNIQLDATATTADSLTVTASIDNTLLKFRSVDETVCTVKAWGNVRPIKAGTCTIEAYADGTDDLNAVVSSINWNFYYPDTDTDGIKDNEDNCPEDANGPDLDPLGHWGDWGQGYAEQKDTDNSGIGDACNTAQDPDGDEYEYIRDNCPSIPNPGQENADIAFGSMFGDDCNSDIDRDGDDIEDGYDNCPNTHNPDQENDGPGVGNLTDPKIGPAGNALGDACDIDTDTDTVLDGEDNCPLVINLDQQDEGVDEGYGLFGAGDGIGDACTEDDDEDKVVNELDNCPQDANTNQLITSPNVVGDVCSADSDGDGVKDWTAAEKDNCPYIPNQDQYDGDANGVGDVCEMVFVVQGGTSETCTTWADACGDISDAIREAKALNRPQIFIAKGVYRHDAGEEVALESGMVLIGGFNGTELYASQAKPSINMTVISGDVNGDDTDVDETNIVRSVETNASLFDDNVSTILSATDQGVGYGNEIRLQGLVINAANGSGLVVNNSQVKVINTQFIAHADSAIKVENGAVVDATVVHFEANRATNGAALFVTGAGEAEVSNSRFFNNIATAKGGAIYQHAGTELTVDNSQFELNTALSAGAIDVGGDATEVTVANVHNSSFTSNSATGSTAGSGLGGAIHINANATLQASKNVFESNSAKNNGGAIALQSTAAMLSDITSSLFVMNNSEGSAGALFVDSGEVNLENSTFYANDAATSGGAIDVDSAATVTVNYVTMASNTAGSGGGAIHNSGGSLQLDRSLVLGNTVGDIENNVENAFIDGGYNIFGFNGIHGLNTSAKSSMDAGPGTSFYPLAAGDAADVAVTMEEILDTSPNFGGGDGYYGDLKAMPLLANSIARDVIPGNDCSGTAKDQRGEARPDLRSGRCDVGAYEYTVLTCAEDANRRYDQGEIFVKSCHEKLENLEIGSVGNFMLALLAMLGVLGIPRQRHA